jgi:membrane-associated phospholipid phosphatase
VASTSLDWRAELGRRSRDSMLIVIFGTSLMTAVFLAGYFFIQTHPARMPFEMPLTRIDSLVPLDPKFLGVYLSLWVYLGAGPGLQPNAIERGRYALWMGALGITALLIFWIWPTRAPPIPGDAGSSGLSFLHQVDLTSNACPSMHVAAAMFTVLRVDSILQQTRASLYMKLFNVGWFVAIAYSTMAIRQHVFLDVIAGALFGAAFAVASLVARR